MARAAASRASVDETPGQLPDLVAVQRVPLATTVYTQLQEAIITGRLAPGIRVRDQDLAKQLGVSRTPVREALKRLEDEGLVESIAGVATRVTDDDSAAVASFPVIATLQALAARLGVRNLTGQDLHEMREANDALREAVRVGDPLEAIRADDRFHGVLVRASGNRELDKSLRRLYPLARRATYRFLADHMEESHAQHAAIIEACARKDVRAAAKLNERNWSPSARLLMS
jgi:DNA-binding GntR family transcriptional regulator